MKNRLCTLLLTILLAGIPTGCSTLLPSARQETRSEWKSFDQAKAAFGKIIPYDTTLEEMKELGFAANITPNLEILTHLDIIERFLTHPSIKKSDLDQGLQDCISLQERCQALKISLIRVEERRYGSVLLDMFDFKQKTKKSGWEFNGLIVIGNGLVVYKLAWGKPQLNEIIEKTKPLGPLQDVSDLLMDVTRSGL